MTRYEVLFRGEAPSDLTGLVDLRGAWCAALRLSAWLNRSPSKRARYDDVLVAGDRSSFTGSDRTYGARRVWHDVLAEGLNAGLHRIERLMREKVCGHALVGAACPRMAG